MGQSQNSEEILVLGARLIEKEEEKIAFGNGKL